MVSGSGLSEFSNYNENVAMSNYVWASMFQASGLGFDVSGVKSGLRHFRRQARVHQISIRKSSVKALLLKSMRTMYKSILVLTTPANL